MDTVLPFPDLKKQNEEKKEMEEIEEKVKRLMRILKNQDAYTGAAKKITQKLSEVVFLDPELTKDIPAEMQTSILYTGICQFYKTAQESFCEINGLDFKEHIQNQTNMMIRHYERSKKEKDESKNNN